MLNRKRIDGSHRLYPCRTFKTQSRATDGIALMVQKVADFTHFEHIMTLIIASIATAFYRIKGFEFAFPIAQNMLFDIAQLADFTDGEVALGWDFR